MGNQLQPGDTTTLRADIEHKLATTLTIVPQSDTIGSMTPEAVVPVVSAVVILLIVIALIAVLVRSLVRLRRYRELEKRDDDPVRYAFIVNPSKPQAEENRKTIEDFCQQRGLTDVVFLETTLQKQGDECARLAIERGADVLVAVGGDGTVRMVASAIANTEHCLGIIPTGTGNLFARNLGIPLGDIGAALAVATSHGSTRVDMGRLHMLDGPDDDGHAFLIIAGIGFDAAMIDDTSPKLKENFSWLAYFMSASKHLFSPKYRASVTITSADGSRHTRKDLQFRTFMAGNCGDIPGFSLMPDASYDDGVLDFEFIDTSGGLIGWANLFGDVVHQTITGKPNQSPLSTNSTIDQIQGTSAEIQLTKKVPVQVDGDVLGESEHIRFGVERRALTVRVPEKPES